jgi:hypothetical protein
VEQEESMTRLIDADALLKYKSDHETISTHLIYNAPTVDAVPVIRCKDCVYNKGITYCYCLIFNGMYGRTLDNYCSRAERKEE